MEYLSLHFNLNKFIFSILSNLSCKFLVLHGGMLILYHNDILSLAFFSISLLST